MSGVLFDLDGVLVDSMPLHREAFLSAVRPFLSLTAEEHDAQLAGLPTREKLRILGFSEADARAIEEDKQAITGRLVFDRIRPDPTKTALFHELRVQGIATAVVSNAVAHSVTTILGLMELSPDLIVTNEDVPRAKPHPDPYIIAMYELGLRPDRTLIVEDAPPGIASATASGAHVLVVSGPEEVNLERVLGALP